MRRWLTSNVCQFALPVRDILVWHRKSAPTGWLVSSNCWGLLRLGGGFFQRFDGLLLATDDFTLLLYH